MTVKIIICYFYFYLLSIIIILTTYIVIVVIATAGLSWAPCGGKVPVSATLQQMLT
jgi:uncharacterized protein YggT (Ycf19 family)